MFCLLELVEAAEMWMVTSEWEWAAGEGRGSAFLDQVYDEASELLRDGHLESCVKIGVCG